MSLKLTGACAPLMVLALRKGQFSISLGREARFGWEKGSLGQYLEDFLKHRENIRGARCVRSLSSPPPRAIVFPGQWTSFFASRTEVLKLERTSDSLGEGKAFDNADFQAPEVLVQSI